MTIKKKPHSSEFKFALEALRGDKTSAELCQTYGIVPSDQGCQFTSTAWTRTLKEQVIDISMTGKGRCLDNIYIERVWRSIKYEEVYT
jgi:putative transposase